MSEENFDEYPEFIFAEGWVGSNGITCLDYMNYDSDVKYIRADLVKTERIPEELITQFKKIGCSSNSCEFNPPEGQGVNGGCSCYRGVEVKKFIKMFKDLTFQ